MTPSCLNTPTGQNFSPTVTPCNSPESTSPTRPLSPEPGPSQIKNRSALLHLEKKALRSLKLLEKVEHFGIDNVMAISPSSSSCRISPLALYSSNIYTHRSSPMAQLTSLKYLAEKRNSDDNLKAHASSDDEAKTPVENNPKKHSSVEGGTTKRHARAHRQRSRRNLLSNGGQRQDLGTVSVRPDLGKIDRQKTEEAPEEKSLVGDFVGTISSLLFGRKGGLL